MIRFYSTKYGIDFLLIQLTTQNIYVIDVKNMLYFLQNPRLVLRINAYKIVLYVRKQEIVLSNISHFIQQKMFVI